MTTETEESNKDLLLGITSLLMGSVYVILFFEQNIGLNYPLFLMLAITAGLFLSHVFSKHLSRDRYMLLGIAGFFSLMVFIRSSELLTFFNVVGSLMLMLISINLFTQKTFKTQLITDYLKVIFLPFRFIGTFFKTFPSVIALKNFSISDPRTREIIRGTLMASVAVLIFAWLFSYADIAFEKFLSQMWDFELDENTFAKIFKLLFVTAFFIGLFGFMFKTVHEPVISKDGTRNLGVLETSILLGAVNLLFLVFIILQVSYLFGGLSHLTTEDLTYAEYARKGFFQLIGVAFLSFIIITFAEKQIIQNNQTHLKSFKVLSCILVVQVILILISAFQRLSLYENAYGFTTIRLYSHALMIWLGIAIVILGVHILKNGKQTTFSFQILTSVILLLFAMNILNPDVFIAKKNLERYQATGIIDAEYLGSLSDDALPYTIYLLDDPNRKVSNDYANALRWRNSYCTLDDCTNTFSESTWQSSRLNRSRAEALIAENIKKINLLSNE